MYVYTYYKYIFKIDSKLRTPDLKWLTNIFIMSGSDSKENMPNPGFRLNWPTLDRSLGRQLDLAPTGLKHRAPTIAVQSLESTAPWRPTGRPRPNSRPFPINEYSVSGLFIINKPSKGQLRVRLSVMCLEISEPFTGWWQTVMLRAMDLKSESRVLALVVTSHGIVDKWLCQFPHM